MIAHAGFTERNGNGIMPAGPLAAVAHDTIDSFFAVREMMNTVRQLAISFGVGYPLEAFQSLLRTYQTLVRAESALRTTAQQVLNIINGAAESEPLA